MLFTDHPKYASLRDPSCLGMTGKRTEVAKRRNPSRSAYVSRLCQPKKPGTRQIMVAPLQVSRTEIEATDHPDINSGRVYRSDVRRAIQQFSTFLLFDFTVPLRCFDSRSIFFIVNKIPRPGGFVEGTIPLLCLSIWQPCFRNDQGNNGHSIWHIECTCRIYRYKRNDFVAFCMCPRRENYRTFY